MMPADGSCHRLNSMTIIANDLLGDFGQGRGRPRTASSWCKAVRERLLLCSSLSKRCIPVVHEY
ncbi:hypothetical protein [Sedimenticola selenatireducens]|uniref:hypothetical protein n=2 Tax=Sedimenticola selenatireducens TaxID=191960 RepID=UPI00374784EA